MIKRIFAVLLSTIMIVSLCACVQKSADENKEVTVSFVNNSDDDVYAIQLEYLVDRQRIGGVSASADPNMTKPFEKGEKVYFGIPKLSAVSEKSCIQFGMLVYVFLEEVQSVPIKFMWEWTARYETEYTFELGGFEETTFTVNKVGNDFNCTVTPWDELPKELLE